MSNIKSEAENKKKDYVFDSELRPLRNISLFEVQCKLNNSGACGKFLNKIYKIKASKFLIFEQKFTVENTIKNLFYSKMCGFSVF